jgi:hypothetical protein
LGLNAFLRFILDSGSVFWLTTHCREADTSYALNHLHHFLQPDNFTLVNRIKGTEWRTMKTEAIDFSVPFFWFDDYVLEAEKRILKQNGSFSSWVSVDLANNDNNICKAVMKASDLYITS